jgi:2-keto-4-pentenoate hydratase/2-oxohepta-3-ene-1,7-dioic acid hydratase in catechol pathway
MRVVRYRTERGARLGILEAGGVVELPDDLALMPAHRLPSDAPSQGLGTRTLEEDALLAPVLPGKIIGIGLNYRDHAEEQGVDLPKEPLLFAKFPSAVTGPYADVEKPADTNQLDFEAELGVVIGRRARHVPASQALEHVGGYVVVNDLTARDAQLGDGQWVRGKSYDGFAPLGPAFVSRDEVADPHRLAIGASVNGIPKQASSTANLIFGVEELVEYCSRCCTLEPGDLICTGTPAGVGVFRDPPELLDVGDVVTVEVENVGRLANRIVAPAPAPR